MIRTWSKNMAPASSPFNVKGILESVLSERVTAELYVTSTLPLESFLGMRTSNIMSSSMWIMPCSMEMRSLWGSHGWLRICPECQAVGCSKCISQACIAYARHGPICDACHYKAAQEIQLTLHVKTTALTKMTGAQTNELSSGRFSAPGTTDKPGSG